MYEEKVEKRNVEPGKTSGVDVDDCVFLSVAAGRIFAGRAGDASEVHGEKRHDRVDFQATA